MKPTGLRLFVAALLVAGIVGGRSVTPPVNYYILRPLDAAATNAPAPDVSSGVTVAVHPVALPDSINRIQMVRRSGSNQLEIAAFHRWADYPDRLVQQVVEDNLQALAPHVRVVPHPWPAGLKPDVTVHLQFRELVGTTDKKMLLSAAWSVVAADNPAAGQFRRTTLSQPIGGSGFDDLAAAHSRLLAALCREVAPLLSN